MTPEEIAALQASKAAGDAEIARLKGELDKVKPTPKPEPKPEDDDINAKAAREAAAREKAATDAKAIEGAINFKLNLPELMKSSKALLPPSMEGLLETAAKEKYDSEIDRSNALRAAMVKEFFAVKDNVELLTASQKAQLTEFLGLTQKAREERAETYYNNLFEPALETNRKVRKAVELAKAAAGLVGSGSDIEEAYKARLIKKSRKYYLNEKESA